MDSSDEESEISKPAGLIDLLLSNISKFLRNVLFAIDPADPAVDIVIDLG